MSEPSFAMANWSKPPRCKVRRKPNLKRRVEVNPRFCQHCGVMLERHVQDSRIENWSDFQKRRFCGRQCACAFRVGSEPDLRGAPEVVPVPGNAAWLANVAEARKLLQTFGNRGPNHWKLSRLVWEEAQRLEIAEYNRTIFVLFSYVCA